MKDSETLESYGVLTEPTTLKIARMLPGPIDRAWAYLTDGDLRRKWLAAGEMELKVGAPFEFVWRNDELTSPPGRRPPEFGEEQRMQSRITELEPPRRLGFAWGEGRVTFDLEPKGDEVLLTVTHTGLSERGLLLMVGAGWHIHLDILVAETTGGTAEPFWNAWTRLRKEYDRRLAA